MKGHPAPATQNLGGTCFDAGMSEPVELPAATAITNLLARYAELIDAGDFVGIGELFAHATITTDGSDSVSFTGAAQVQSMYDGTTRKHADGTPRSKHVITNPIVELDGPDSARCRSYYTVFMCTETLPLQPIVAGRYRDGFERVDGVWRWATRHMIVEFVGNISEHLTMSVKR
jgi:3-phenylpropionate/cinnamic acid dioxygenase small subunit